MQKFNTLYVSHYIYICFSFMLLSQNFGNGLVALNNECQKFDECFFEYDLDDDDEINCNEDLGKFEEMYLEIEGIILSSDYIEDSRFVDLKGNLISSWTKECSRYLLKKVKKLFCSLADINEPLSIDDVAYRVARFKRSIDRIYNTGSIEDIFARMFQHIPKEVDASMYNPFKERVKFFYNNKKTKPKDLKLRTFNNTGIFGYDDKKESCIKLNTIYTLYGAEFFCGALICVLPFPGSRVVGGAMMIQGGQEIVRHFFEQLSEQSDQNDRINRGNSAQNKMRDLEDLKMVDFYYEDAA